MPKYKGIVNLTLICVNLLFYIIWNSSAFLCGFACASRYLAASCPAQKGAAMFEKDQSAT